MSNGKVVLIPFETFEELGGYLMSRPWAEVEKLIPKLQGLKVADATVPEVKPDPPARRRAK